MKSGKAGKKNLQGSGVRPVNTAFKIGGAVLLVLAVAVLSIAARYKFKEWQFENLVAEAEAWNLNHWETGEALEAKFLIEATVRGTTQTTEETIHCYQKRIVDYGSHWSDRVVSQIVVKSFPRYVHRFRENGRSVRLFKTEALCETYFRDGASSDLPSVVYGEIFLEALSDLPNYGNRPLRSCDLNWSTGTPLQLEGDVSLKPVQLLDVTKVKMKTAIPDQRLVGPASTIRELLMETLSAPALTNVEYQWDQTALCWVRPGQQICETRGDDACGVPKL